MVQYFYGSYKLWRNKLEGQKRNGFLAWLENFWYHYKTQTLIAIVAIFTAVVCTVQLATKTKYDYYLLYAGPEILAVQDLAYIQRAVASVGTDQDGDGEINVALKDIVMLSPEERADAVTEKDAEFNEEFIQTEMTSFYQQIMAGDATIMLLSPYMYEQAKESGLFMPISEIFTEIPEAVYDETGIVLSKTEFGQSFNGIDDLPEDTILCIRRVTSFQNMKNSKKAEKAFDANLELFKNIVNYTK